MSFDEWCQFYLNHPRAIVHISNQQTRAIGGVYGSESLRMTQNGCVTYDLDQALRNLRTVDLIGRTEFFSLDLQRFKRILAGHDVALRKTDIEPQNVAGTDFRMTVPERIDQLRQEMSPASFEQLSRVNQQDFALYDAASQFIDDYC